MEQDGVLVAGEVHVALHAVGTVGNGLEVSGAGVFGKCSTGAPVGVNQRAVRNRLVKCHEDTLADGTRTHGTRLGTCR
ncbi:hypothetical protein GCM10009712_22870 [Pseudarthrobacter sulfonivorans]